jgi:hypothetical protein
MSQPPLMEPIFDRTPHLFGTGPVDPIVCDASLAALRQRTVNFIARRYADMMMVSGLDQATADRHFRLRAAVAPAGLVFRRRRRRRLRRARSSSRRTWLMGG